MHNETHKLCLHLNSGRGPGWCTVKESLVVLWVVLSPRLMSLWKNNALPSFEEFFAASTVPDICFGEGKYLTANGNVTCAWDAMSAVTVSA